nr:unnamed protein product [Callosobruchus analis]
MIIIKSKADIIFSKTNMSNITMPDRVNINDVHIVPNSSVRLLGMILQSCITIYNKLPTHIKRNNTLKRRDLRVEPPPHCGATRGTSRAVPSAAPKLAGPGGSRGNDQYGAAWRWEQRDDARRRRSPSTYFNPFSESSICTITRMHGGSGVWKQQKCSTLLDRPMDDYLPRLSIDFGEGKENQEC